MTTVKITELTNIGANLATSTLVPVVNMAGTPTTQKTTVGNIANLILEGAGVDYPEASVALLAQTVSNAAQPNITSTGTLTGLTVSGNTNLGAVANVRITGGTSGYVLSTDGAGNLSWAAGGGGGSYGNSNVAAYLPTYTGNVGANVVIANLFAGSGANLTNIPGGNVSGQVSYAATANSVAAANVSGLGNIATINLDGNLSNALLGNGAWGPVEVNVNSIYNGTSSVQIPSSNGNVAINVGSNSWVFTTDGDVNLPGNSYLLTSGEIGFLAAANIAFEITTSNSANYTWNFNPDGSLLIPEQLTGRASIFSRDSNANTTSFITFPTASVSNLTVGTNNTHSVIINTDHANTNLKWIFDDVGNLTLPTNTSSINYANGSPYGGGATDELVNGDNSFVLDVDGNVVFQGLAPGLGVDRGLVWDYGANANGVNSQVRQDNNGITVRAWTENSGNYSAPVNIVTNQDSNTKTWTFDGQGNLTLPGNLILLGNIEAFSSGIAFTSGLTGIDTANSIVIITVADNVFNDPYSGPVTISGVNAPSQVNGNWYYQALDSNLFQLYTDSSLSTPVDGSAWPAYPGGDGTAVGTIDYSNLAIRGGNVFVGSNDETWVFDSNGVLNTPNNSSSFVSGRIQTANGYPTLLGYGSGGHGGPELDYCDGDDPANIFENPDVYRNVLYINDGGLYVGMNENGNTSIANGANNSWLFAPNGSTRFPTLTVDLHNGGNQQAETLQFGNGSVQAVITGPTPAEGNNAQRLIIQGQRGTGGEGGDVYLWGGDSDVNGGDIKIYAGDADVSGYGGYINLDGGSGVLGGGQLTLTGGQSSDGQGGQISITPGYSGNGNGAILTLNGGQGSGDGGAVNITAGYGGANGGQVTITGGQSALGLPGYGNVIVNAGASSWSFNNEGNLVLAGGNSVIQSIANSSLDPLNPNVSTMVLTPDATYNGQALVLDPTAPGHIHLRAPGGNIDEPVANLFLGGETSSFEVGYGANANVYIHSNNYTWTYGSNGVVSTAGEFILQAVNDTVNLQTLDSGSGNIYSAYLGTNGGWYLGGTEYLNGWLNITPTSGNADINAPAGNINIKPAFGVTNSAGKSLNLLGGDADQSDFYTGTGGAVNITGGLGSSNDGGGGGPGGNINITAGESSDPAGHAGNVNITSELNQWTFDYTGNLTLPSNTFSVNYANGTQVSLGGSYGDSNVATFLGSYGSNTISTTGNVRVGQLSATATDSYNSIQFSDNGTNDNGYLKVDAGNNMVINAVSNFYVKRAGSDRIAVTDTNSDFMATSNVTIQANKGGTTNTWSFYANGVLNAPGAITSTGNITGANLVTGGVISVTGNANIGNIGTAGLITATGNITGGNIIANGNVVGNTNGYTIGYLNIPQVAASNVTLGLTDAGKHYYSTTAGNLVLTVPLNSSVAFPTGTAISIVVQAAGNILVNAAAGVTLYMAGNSTSANRVVGTYGMATLMKVASDTWFINGTGVS